MILRNNVHAGLSLRLSAVLTVVVSCTLWRGVSNVAAHEVALGSPTAATSSRSQPNKPRSYTAPLLIGMIDTGSATPDKLSGAAHCSPQWASEPPAYALQVSIFQPAHENWADQTLDSTLPNSSYSLLEGRLPVGAFMYEGYTIDLLPKAWLLADENTLQAPSMGTPRPLLQLEGGSWRLSVAVKDNLLAGR
jgi:hypothetical protein